MWIKDVLNAILGANPVSAALLCVFAALVLLILLAYKGKLPFRSSATQEQLTSKDWKRIELSIERSHLVPSLQTSIELMASKVQRLEDDMAGVEMEAALAKEGLKTVKESVAEISEAIRDGHREVQAKLDMIIGRFLK